MTPNGRILFVDDEKNLLDALARGLAPQHAVMTATSGAEGITALGEHRDIAVVVADLRMPAMNGIEFLSRVRKHYPDCIRVMLTGAVDLQAAIDAVNEGNIFRFITKPCPTANLSKVLDDCLRQYRLIKAERDLLENTLKSAIKVLVDILSLTNPLAFSRALRIKYFVVNIVEKLKIESSWIYDVAAMLSQIGFVTIPTYTLEKVYYNKELSVDEQDMLTKLPLVGYDLLSNIPRLESVAEIIRRQSTEHAAKPIKPPFENCDAVDIGAEVLHFAIEFETLIAKGVSKGTAIRTLREHEWFGHGTEIIAILKELDIPDLDKKVIKVHIKHLHKGLIIEEDFYTINNVLLVSRGQEVTDTVRTLLENHLAQNDIKDEILVSIAIQQGGGDSDKDVR